MNVKIRIFDEYTESTYKTLKQTVDDYAKKVFSDLLAHDFFPSIFRSNYKIKDGIFYRVIVADMDDPNVGLGSIGFGLIEIRAINQDIYAPIRVTIYVGDGDYVKYWKGLIGLLRHNLEPLDEIPSKLRTYDIADEPWKQIQDEEQRDLIEFWWKNYEVKWMAEKFRYATGTIRNKITEIRKEYGEEIVPYRKKP